MHLGVVPLLDGDSGGIYQYSLSVLKALARPEVLAPGDRVTLFVHNPKALKATGLNAPEWAVRSLSPPSMRRRLSGIARAIPGAGALIRAMRSRRGPGAPRIPFDLDLPRRNPRLGQWFRANGVDLMLYPVPMSIAFESGVPYIFTVHDLQHRLQPEFPEVGAEREWRAREYLFRNGTREALLIVGDSEVGREDVVACYGSYGVSADKVVALPFLPAEYLPRTLEPGRVAAARIHYGLPERYFFYPAQFWPHKNHTRLIESLARLKGEYGIWATLALCGSHANWIREATFQDVMALAVKLDVADQVRYLGFVPDHDMASLYGGARALLMPTFFGPTNIPILEAWSLGCPVMTSDIRGVRDQAGDAALLIDPLSVEAMAAGMARLWQDEAYRESLIRLGRARLSQWTADDFAVRLGEILARAGKELGKQRPAPGMDHGIR